MRLIDADELEEKAWRFGLGTREDVANLINNAPTVDPVKHGHWDNKIIDSRFDDPHTVARCSNCKGKIWVFAVSYVVKYPYCPMCGAKMESVIEDEVTGCNV